MMRRLLNATASFDFIEMKAIRLIHSLPIKAGAGEQVAFHSALPTLPKAPDLGFFGGVIFLKMNEWRNECQSTTQLTSGE